jgi:hypothetical protein
VKGSAISMAILSNGSPTLYWCMGPRILVLGPRLSAEVSCCWHHISMSLLECGQ